MKQSIEKLANHNKIYTIKYKLIEELNELLEAVEENDDKHILEECADVMIMIQQFIEINELQEEIDKMIKYKIERTFKRLGI